MAQLSGDESDRALWLTLAQSWVRLAEHVAHADESLVPSGDGYEASAIASVHEAE